MTTPLVKYALRDRQSPSDDPFAEARREINIKRFRISYGRCYSPMLDRHTQSLDRKCGLVGVVDYEIDANPFLDCAFTGCVAELLARNRERFITGHNSTIPRRCSGNLGRRPALAIVIPRGESS